MNDRAVIRSFEGIYNKRFITFVALALLAFGLVVAGVVSGFRGHDVYRGADAMTLVRPAQPQMRAAPPAVPEK
jgi:hypothetical protein